jgi:hypothetical protein
MAIATGGSRAASSTRTVIATSRAWRCAAFTLTLVTRAFVYASRIKLVSRLGTGECVQHATVIRSVRSMRTFVTGAVLVLIIHGSGSHGDGVAW